MKLMIQTDLNLFKIELFQSLSVVLLGSADQINKDIPLL